MSLKKVKRSLIVFDVEGVILPKGHYLFFAASKHLGIRCTLLVIFLGFLYEVGLRSLEYTLKKIYRLFKGISLDELDQTFMGIPLIPGSFEVFQTLKEKGYKTALISSGLPDRFVKDLAKRVGADYGYGLELDVDNDLLTGEIRGNIIKEGGKAIILKKLQNDEGFVSDNCTVVADDRNNSSMTPLCNISIGYNSDFIFSSKSNYNVKGDLTEILPYIENDLAKAKSTSLSENEYFRETIHMGSYMIPFICRYFGIDVPIGVLILLVATVYTASELYRLVGKGFPLFSTITARAVVGEENWDFAASPIFFAWGVSLPLLVFPKPIGYAAIAVLTLGDGGASVFGRRFGRTRIPFNKSKTLEGTVIGFFFAFIGALMFVDPLKSLIAASVGIIVESAPSPINDNISIPILTGLAIMLVSLIL